MLMRNFWFTPNFTKFFSLFNVVTFVALLGCSPDDNGLYDSPEKVVRAFYICLNRGEYTKAKRFYTTEAKQAVNGLAMAREGGFTRFGDRETRKGTIRAIKILKSTKRGEGAIVDYRIQYRDGYSVSKTVSLAKENGRWKIGLIQN